MCADSRIKPKQALPFSIILKQSYQKEIEVNRTQSTKRKIDFESSSLNFPSNKHSKLSGVSLCMFFKFLYPILFLIAQIFVSILVLGLVLAQFFFVDIRISIRIRIT